MQEEPIKLPGFGLPLTSYPSGEFDHHNDGRRARFPHAIADKCQSYGIMLGERRMMEFINQITDKKDWDKKVFDEEIVTKWRDEADVLDETKMEGEETVLIKGKVRSTKGRLDDSYLLPERFDYVSCSPFPFLLTSGNRWPWRVRAFVSHVKTLAFERNDILILTETVH